jgi:hypothetical protein
MAEARHALTPAWNYDGVCNNSLQRVKVVLSERA